MSWAGFEVCNKIRNDAKSDVPILMLTARDQIQDKLEGFKKGADDYLVKPARPAELKARLNALSRRTNNEVEEQDELIIGPYIINQGKRFGFS